MSQWRLLKGKDGITEITTTPGAAVWIPLAILAMGLVATLVAVLISVIQFARVDACLDSGGRFDYERGACDHEATGPSP